MSAKTARELLAWVVDLFMGLYDLVKAGKRDGQHLGEVLQWVKDHADFHARLFPKKVDDDLPRFSVEDWMALYLDAFRDHVAGLFGKSLSYAQLTEKLREEINGVKLPQREGFDWLVIVLRGLTPEKVFAVFSRRCPAAKYRDLNTGQHDRNSDRTYAVSFRARVEADEELKGKSADDLAASNTPSITLLERLLLEVMYASKTAGRHLDLVHWTLCAGSRLPDGYVPRVILCGDGDVYVRDWLPSTASDALSTREAVRFA